jgi:DNA (cytosine-5)-methyltransferase 1
MLYDNPNWEYAWINIYFVIINSLYYNDTCRYMQVGNAVAVPVARALGYSLGLAYLGKHDGSSDPLFKLPANFFSPGQTEGVVRASSVELPVGEVAEQ